MDWPTALVLATSIVYTGEAVRDLLGRRTKEGDE